MRNVNGNRESRLASLVAFSASLWIILTSFLQFLVGDLIPQSSFLLKILIKLFVLIVSITILYIGREKIVKLFLYIWTIRNTSEDERKICREWTITIQYKDISGNGSIEIARIGRVKIESRPTGLIMSGDRIIDTITRNPVVEEWSSEHAELMPDNVLIYAYKTRVNNNSKYDKVGYVVLQKQETGVWDGVFMDTSAASPTKILRQGTVSLH